MSASAQRVVPRGLIRAILARRRRSTFTHYYEVNWWKDGESRSGPGSRRDSPAVAHCLPILSSIVEKYEIRSMADIPCGDFNWIGAFLEARSELDYSGFDIVEELIERNRLNHADRKFDLLDIVATVPPKVDLIFCKDLINHLENHEIFKAVANMRLSGSTYCLVTNNFGYKNTRLWRTSRSHSSSRHVDLTTVPYRYPPPLWRSHYLGLWRLHDMERRPR
jgi:hypothetical protein